MSAGIEKTKYVNASATEASDLTYGIALIDKLTNSVVGPDAEFNAKKLMESFGVALHQLIMLKKELKHKLYDIETMCREAERNFHFNINNLVDQLSRLHTDFSAQYEQVRTVSGKLVQLSDELGRKRLPCKRIADARASILEFFKFVGAGGGTFTSVAVNSSGDESQLIEAATRIKNLAALCLELPNDEPFLEAKQRITVARQQVEKELLEKFKQACRDKDLNIMKPIADVLISTSGSSACTQITIDEALKGIDSNYLDFNAITTQMVEAEKEICALFSHPHTVVLRLVYSLFRKKIKVYLDNRIVPRENRRERLNSLCSEYQNVEKLMKALSDQLNLVTDPAQLSGLFLEVFQPHLRDYIDLEIAWLDECISDQLTHFYKGYNHKKRDFRKVRAAELGRELIAKLGIAVIEKDRAACTMSFISEQVSVNIIGYTRESLRRCQLLSESDDRASNGSKIFDILHRRLISDYLDYGVTLALQGLQMIDWHNLSPNMVFFAVTHDASLTFQHFTKTVEEIMPLVSSNMTIMQDIKSKRLTSEQELEEKISLGLERCITMIIDHMRQFLPADQRRAEFRPNDDDCQRTRSFFHEVIRQVREQLDGDNLKTVLKELGVLFTDLVIKRLTSCTYTVDSGCKAMQHVTLYRDAASYLKDPTVDEVFNLLLQLMNLMPLRPENVGQVVQDYLQLGIHKSILTKFLQLREDYKSAKLDLNIK